jgi:hypothetical protein
MRRVLQGIDEEGGIEAYLLSIGVTAQMLAAVRANLIA